MRLNFHVLTAGLTVVAFGVSQTPAAAEPPTPPAFDGSMSFTSIKGPADPEEFSWEVTLGEDQELQQIDDQQARVIYVGTEHIAFSILAGPAHDSVGSNVPTSLAVSGGNVVTLTVHHRAGNPANDGDPFVYPISAGAGWEGGFVTPPIAMPPPQSPVEVVEKTSTNCVLPVLVGRSLKSARKRLRRADCRLGKVWGKRSKAARVSKQSPLPGEPLARGGKVSLTLAQPNSA